MKASACERVKNFWPLRTITLAAGWGIFQFGIRVAPLPRGMAEQRHVEQGRFGRVSDGGLHGRDLGRDQTRLHRVGFLNPLLRVVEPLPDTEELNRIAGAQPVPNEIIGALGILEPGDVREADEVLFFWERTAALRPETANHANHAKPSAKETEGTQRDQSLMNPDSRQ